MQSMKAVRIHSYGGPEVLKYEDAPRPQPDAGDLLVHVHAAGVNPIDWKIRQGQFKDSIPYSLPFIPGWDFSGIVESTGRGTSKFQKNDGVFARPDIARNGAYAEYIAVRIRNSSQTQVVRPPACGGNSVSRLTAWKGIFDTGGLSAGQKILIHAASGGVGSFAVQLAKWKGAYVFGTASGSNQSFLKELGVDKPIDYKKTRFEDVVHDVDVVFDTIGGDTQQRSFEDYEEGRHPCFHCFAAVAARGSQTWRMRDPYLHSTRCRGPDRDSRTG